MIAQLRGVIAAADADRLVVDVGGVGFEVFVPAKTAARAGARLGQEAAVLTHLHVRDDALQLFGFDDQRELGFFRQLIGVSGVGPKVALAILSAYPVEQLELAVLQGDHKRFESIPGIGRKLAQRLVVELKDRIVPSPALGPSGQIAPGPADAVLAARSALVNLGLSFAEADAALKDAPGGESVEELIRYALARVKS